ncbi:MULTISPECIES: ATP-binding protein [unclassified Streptomyces]|uniref:ATP-binding protein n=1 Tax=unclassified Streptomyces TaxID=2593676 RepID=UPI0006AE7C48|nr:MULTISPECIES: AAA family ATPase [unclassified Streptomyces]KOX22014.1 regulator [Streptomyces sp. NRRL F-6491]KOX41652.1 regulator [Streptomyces sp. NRRL F-6492]
MRRSNLPAELNRFVGRAAEQAALAALLGTSRLVTVVGVGGVGKTRLALRTAAGVRERHGDGIGLADLAPLRDPDLVAHALAEALGLTDHTPRPPREALKEHLAERRMLLVLDGFEHLVESCAPLVRELLAHAPGLTVLATGRRPLRVAGEAVFPLAPMDEADAVALLAERAAEAGAPVLPVGAGTPAESDAPSGRGPGPSEVPEAVRELCRRLDGIPLAVELAAGRLPLLSVEQMLHRLDDRFRLLADGERGALPRHRTLRTAIGWSHELCTPRERLLWARLSVFAGPFDLEAVEYVCGGRELPPERILDLLGGLLAQSLVSREDTPAGPVYRMLGTVAAYGAEWLAALGDTERMRRRHRDWYMGLATWCELEWFSPRQAEVAARTDVALPQLRAALELCLELPEDAHLAQHLAGTLWFAWAGCGRLTEGRYWLDRALALDSGHQGARLKALWVLGYVAVLQGDGTAAVAALHECGERARSSGNALAEAYATHRMGCLALLTDDAARAEELIGRALDSYRELGELNSNVLMGQVEVAMARAFRGDPEGAAVLCREVREICEERGELWTRAYALYVLAYAAWTRDAYGEARELLTECVSVNHVFHDLVGLVLAIELLALVTVSEGDPAEAAVFQGAAVPVWDAVGVRLFGSESFGGPGRLCEGRAREALGAEAYEEAFREGRGLSLDAVVERALAGRRGPAAGGPATPRPFRTGRSAGVPGTRKPAGSPTGKGGEAAG